MLATPELIREAALPARLEGLLPRWFREIPLYRDAAGLWRQEERTDPVANLRRLPFITKQDIRHGFPQNFLRAGAELDDLLDRGLIELEHTSGTSEERTPLLLGLGWWNEQEQRALRLNAIVARVLDEFPNPRRVTISSPVCSGDICYTGVPSRSERVVGDALFVSLSRFPFLWSETDLARMADEAAEWQPQFLDVDPVYGVAFALYCQRRGIRLPSLRFVICSYEFVSVVHREVLQRVFGVPVFNLYGSTETGHLLMEDEQGEMRPSLETAFFELAQVDERGIGDLVLTTLTNDYMPLIRYRIGDLVERRELPYRTGYLVHGRAADAVITATGARVTVWEIDQCFAGLQGIAHYQLLQQAGGKWLLRFVADRQAPAMPQLSALHDRLGALLGGGNDLEMQQTDMLMPESSGKFRLVYPARKAVN